MVLKDMKSGKYLKNTCFLTAVDFSAAVLI